MAILSVADAWNGVRQLEASDNPAHHKVAKRVRRRLLRHERFMSHREAEKKKIAAAHASEES